MTILFISYHHWDSEVPAAIRSRRLASTLRSLEYKVNILSRRKEGGSLLSSLFVDSNSCLSQPESQVTLLKAHKNKRKAGVANDLISKLLSLVFCDIDLKWSFWVGRLLFSKPYRHKYKLVIVTGRPFLVFLAVYAYAVFYGKRYILDYRDSWLENPGTAWYSRFFRPLLRILESIAVKRASGVISASRSISQSLGFNRPENVLYNYPCLDYSKRLQDLYFWQPLSKRAMNLVLTYTGSVFKVNSLSPICKAIALLDQSNTLKLEFHYYGASSSQVRQEFVKHKIIHLLHDHGPVPKDTALKALSNADVAICTTYSLLRKPTKMELGLVTTKIFDYILIGVPTIVVSPKRSELRGILKEFGEARVRIFEPSENAGIADTLKEFADKKEDFTKASLISYMHKTLDIMSTKASINAYRLERLVKAGIDRN